MKRRLRKPWAWRRTSCRFPPNSSPVREGVSHAAAYGKNPRSGRGRIACAGEGSDGDNFPAALPAFDGTSGSAQATPRSKKRSGAGENTRSRTGAESREGLMTTETQSAPVAERGERTVLTGKVTSAKMEKTIVVEVQRLVQHPKYRRVVRISKKFYAHDENRQAKTGDTVRIVASRPLSKLKRWRLKEVLTRNASGS